MVSFVFTYSCCFFAQCLDELLMKLKKFDCQIIRQYK